KHRFAIAVSIDSTQDRHLPIKICERLRFGVIFAQPRLQHTRVIVAPTFQAALAIWTNRSIGKLRAVGARREAACAALQSTGNSCSNDLFRYYEQNLGVDGTVHLL